MGMDQGQGRADGDREGLDRVSVPPRGLGKGFQQVENRVFLMLLCSARMGDRQVEKPVDSVVQAYWGSPEVECVVWMNERHPE